MSGTCGTGRGNFPQPGDPNLNVGIILTAVSAYGGIAISWTYPTLLPEAVAHTLLYRSTVNNFFTATQIAIVSGNNHFERADTLANEVTYFYWIKIVSVNGTIGNTIGPSSATMFANLNDLIDQLTSTAGDEFLHEILRTPIGTAITTIENSLLNEINGRDITDNAATALMTQVQASVDSVNTLIVAETTERIDGSNTLVQTINGVATTSGQATAAVGDQVAVVTADLEAQALRITTAESNSTYGQAAVTQVHNAVTGVNGLTSQWYVKTSVASENNPPRIAGFGLHNTGADSAFIVDAESFKIGLTNPPGGDPLLPDFFPFVVTRVGGLPTVAINAQALIKDAAITNAMINTAAVDTLKIAGNAVIVPLGITNDASGLVLDPVWRAVATLTMAGSGVIPASVHVQGVANIANQFNTDVLETCGLRIKAVPPAGAPITYGQISGAVMTFTGTLTTMATFNNQLYGTTYTLEAQTGTLSPGMLKANVCSLTIIGIKR